MPEQPPEWPEAMATVLSCTYRPRVGRAVAFGLPSSKHYRITYNYWADGELRSAEMWSEKPIPQGSVFPIRYDPQLPGRSHRNNEAMPGSKTGLVTVGIVGSVLLSLAWFLVLRGCR